MHKIQCDSPCRISFRRWTRKSYAVFISLNRIIRIGVLSVTCSLLVMPGHCQEQPDTLRVSDTDREIELDELVVSAQRTPLVQSQLMRAVQVITRAEIEQSPSGDLSGLLEHLCGIDIRQRGAPGMQADISIRGGSFDQTMVLLNGVNLSDPQTGHHNLNLPVDISSIQRIEVLQGPGARVFGPNAFNGVINIITGEPGKDAFFASFSGGQHGLINAAGNMSVNTGKLFNHLAVSGNQSNGYKKNTDFKNGNLYYRAHLSLGAGSIDFQTGLASKAFGANSFYTPVYPDQFEKTFTEFASLTINTHRKLHLKPLIYWRRHHDRFELFRDTVPVWYSGHNYHLTDVAGGSLNWSNSGKYRKTSLGLDYRYEHIFSNVLGNPMAVPKSVPGESGKSFTRDYHRESLSMMAEQAYFYKSVSFSAGLLAYYNHALSGKFSFYPGIDIGWQIKDQMRFYVTANRTMRLPTFTDLFYTGPTNIANPALKPEEAVSVETGLITNTGYAEFQVAVYRRWGKNMIDWVKFPDDDKWKSLNLTKVNITGLETNCVLNFNKESDKRFVRKAGLQYSLILTDKESKGFTSRYVLDNLRHKLDFNVDHRLTMKSGIDWKISWQDRAGGYIPFADNVSASEVPYKPVLIADVKGYYEWKMIRIFIAVSNLFDTEVIDHANVTQPGRWISGGISIRTGF